jgi:hypothetical protein
MAGNDRALHSDERERECARQSRFTADHNERRRTPAYGCELRPAAKLRQARELGLSR